MLVLYLNMGTSVKFKALYMLLKHVYTRIPYRELASVAFVVIIIDIWFPCLNETVYIGSVDKLMVTILKDGAISGELCKLVTMSRGSF